MLIYVFRVSWWSGVPWFGVLVGILVERLVHVWGPNWATEGRVSQMSSALTRSSNIESQQFCSAKDVFFVILANQILTVPMVQYGGQIRTPTSIRGRNLIISSWASWGVWSWLTLVLHLRREWKGLGAFLKRESGDFLTRIRLQCLQWEDCCFPSKVLSEISSHQGLAQKYGREPPRKPTRYSYPKRARQQ